MTALTKNEIRLLLAEAHKDNTVYWLMLLVAFSHGLRVSEVINLRKRDIESGYITVRRLKGSLKTTQPLVSSSDPVLDEKTVLEAYVKVLPDPDTRLFPTTRMTAWRKVQKYGLAAGIPKHKCHPHVLKHTIAMLSIKKAGIENVRQYLGHKSLSSTGAYLRVSDDEASEAVTGAL